MLTTSTDVERVLNEFPTVDTMEQELTRLEALFSQIRARQVEILAAIDHLQVPTWDGALALPRVRTAVGDPHHFSHLSRDPRGVLERSALLGGVEVVLGGAAQGDTLVVDGDLAG